MMSFENVKNNQILYYKNLYLCFGSENLKLTQTLII